MTWSAEKAAAEIWRELLSNDGVDRELLVSYLQEAYDAGRRASDEADEQAAFDKFVAPPGDPDEGLPTIDEVRGILKIPPDEAYLCAQTGGHRYGTNGRCIWCDAERGDGT